MPFLQCGLEIDSVGTIERGITHNASLRYFFYIDEKERRKYEAQFAPGMPVARRMSKETLLPIAVRSCSSSPRRLIILAHGKLGGRPKDFIIKNNNTFAQVDRSETNTILIYPRLERLLFFAEAGTRLEATSETMSILFNSWFPGYFDEHNPHGETGTRVLNYILFENYYIPPKFQPKILDESLAWMDWHPPKTNLSNYPLSWLLSNLLTRNFEYDSQSPFESDLRVPTDVICLFSDHLTLLTLLIYLGTYQLYYHSIGMFFCRDHGEENPPLYYVDELTDFLQKRRNKEFILGLKAQLDGIAALLRAIPEIQASIAELDAYMHRSGTPIKTPRVLNDYLLKTPLNTSTSLHDICLELKKNLEKKLRNLKQMDKEFEYMRDDYDLYTLSHSDFILKIQALEKELAYYVQHAIKSEHLIEIKRIEEQILKFKRYLLYLIP